MLTQLWIKLRLLPKIQLLSSMMNFSLISRILAFCMASLLLLLLLHRKHMLLVLLWPKVPMMIPPTLTMRLLHSLIFSALLLVVMMSRFVNLRPFHLDTKVSPTPVGARWFTQLHKSLSHIGVNLVKIHIVHGIKSNRTFKILSSSIFVFLIWLPTKSRTRIFLLSSVLLLFLSLTVLLMMTMATTLPEIPTILLPQTQRVKFFFWHFWSQLLGGWSFNCLGSVIKNN